MDKQIPPASEPALQPTGRDRIMDTLRLARARLTSPDLDEKATRRAALDDLIVRMNVFSTAPGYDRPTADELRAALGDPDDREIRRALDEWDVGLLP